MAKLIHIRNSPGGAKKKKFKKSFVIWTSAANHSWSSNHIFIFNDGSINQKSLTTNSGESLSNKNGF